MLQQPVSKSRRAVRISFRGQPAEPVCACARLLSSLGKPARPAVKARQQLFCWQQRRHLLQIECQISARDGYSQPLFERCWNSSVYAYV